MRIPFIAGIILFFLSLHVTTAFAQHEYKIGGSLYVNYPGDYPAGYQPEWNFITYDYEAPTFDEYADKNMGSFKNTNRVRLTEENGKAVFIHNGNYNVADIELPAEKVVLNATRQTFRLINFRAHGNGSGAGGAQPAGTISLSADADGTITASFSIEYSVGGKFYMRSTAEAFHAPLTQKPKDAVARKDDAKYDKALEELINIHYDGWRFDKFYVPGSMHDSKVEKRDAAGRPTEISATYSSSEGFTSTFRVLYSEGAAYAIVDPYSDNKVGWQLNCILPYKNVNNQRVPFSGAEKAKLQNLQRKYLLDQWTAKFEKTAKESNQLKFLVPAQSYQLRSSTYETEDYEDLKDKEGNVIGQYRFPKTETSTRSVAVPGIKNTSDDYTIIKDYRFEETANTIAIIDETFWMRAGEVIDAFTVNPSVNNVQGMSAMIQRKGAKPASAATTGTGTASRPFFSLLEIRDMYASLLSGQKTVNWPSLMKSKNFLLIDNRYVNPAGDELDYRGGKGFGDEAKLGSVMDYLIVVPSAKFADSLLNDLKTRAQHVDATTYTFEGQYLVTVKDEQKNGKPAKHFYFSNNSDGHVAIGAKKTASNKLEVDSRSSSTGIILKAGYKVSLAAEGKVRLGPAEYVKESGPAGNAGLNVFGNLTSFKAGALIGKIGQNGQWFLVGSSLSFTAETSGELILRINDVNPEDNTGSFTVTWAIEK